MRIFKSNSSLGFLPFSVFAVSQIESTRNQNQCARVNIFSGNFEEKNECKTSRHEQFQIAIRRDGRDVDQTKCFKNKVLNKVAAKSQKEQHCEFERSRSQPNFASCGERNKACNKREIKQHRDAAFFRGDHFFDQNILQCEKESGANRDAVKDVEMKFIIGCPSCDNRQSYESDQGCDPSKFGYVFSEKNFGEYEREQRNRPKNDNDLGQRQFDHSIDIEKETYRAENSSDDIQKKLVGFDRGFSLVDYKRKQSNQTEKKSEKSHLKSAQSLPYEFRNYVISAADKHMAEKKHDPLPISIQTHKFSETESGSFITFMVGNENIF